MVFCELGWFGVWLLRMLGSVFINKMVGGMGGWVVVYIDIFVSLGIW